MLFGCALLGAVLAGAQPYLLGIAFNVIGGVDGVTHKSGAAAGSVGCRVDGEPTGGSELPAVLCGISPWGCNAREPKIMSIIWALLLVAGARAAIDALGMYQD